MKHFLLSSLLLFFYLENSSQQLTDSLKGFDLSKAVMDAHSQGFFGVETKVVVNYMKRDFIKKKFNLRLPQTPVVARYSTNVIANAPCQNEDFESYSTGQYATSNMTSWSINEASNNFFSSVSCSTANISFTATTNNFYIYATPVTDANCNNVATSPFGGSKVACLNKNYILNNTTRLAQTFSVTNSNCFYYYAYKPVLQDGSHTCCTQTGLVFNFYNCSNVLIGSLSDTLICPSFISGVCTPYSGWSSSSGWYYTANWVTAGVNLIPYIGSCITVEVIASNCATGGHIGYCYYDAQCSSTGIVVNGDLVNTGSYTSCPVTATITAPPGYSSYSWQGPSGSGVSTSTSSFVTTNLSGNYTLTAGSGSLSITQTVNLMVNSAAQNVNISAPTNTLCFGQTMTLQATGSGLSNYSWTPGGNTQFIYVTPTVNTIYSVTATNSLGCSSSDIKTITVVSSPAVYITSPGTSVCLGQSLYLNTNAGGAATYSWSNGPSTSSILVSPTITTVYKVTVFNTLGCSASDTKTIVVNSLPVLQVGLSNSVICAGQSATVSANAGSIISYSWNTSVSNASFVASPTLTSVYSVSVTNTSLCSSSASGTLVVIPAANLQLTASTYTICAGQNAVLTASGNSLSSYAWNMGPNTPTVLVSPSLTSVYSVTVSNSYGCQESQTETITVLPVPQLQVTGSASLVCPGGEVNFTATGNTNPSPVWNTGAVGIYISTNPSVTSVYSASVTASNGCVGSASVTVQVYPITQVLINATSTFICIGETIQLTEGGAGIISYTWSTGSTAATLNFTPQATTNYSITGTDLNGCKSGYNKLVTVDGCLGLLESQLPGKAGIKIFPNPTIDSFTIKGTKTEKGELINDLGQVIREFNLSEENDFAITIKGLAKGIYFVRTEKQSTKVIVK